MSMAHDDKQDKDVKDEALQKKLIEAYGSHSNIGLAKYHIRETAKLVLSGRQYAAIDACLNSCGNNLSVDSLKRLYHSAVETLIDYQRQRRKRQDEDFYTSRPRFLDGYSFRETAFVSNQLYSMIM